MKILDVPKDILLLLAQAQGGSDWPAPDEIFHSLLPVAQFESALLPDALWPWVKDIAHRMQCPVDFAAVAGVASFASVIGAACAIRPKQKDNWTEVPNLWGAVVGAPGRLKSPALAAGLAPLRKLAHDANVVFRSATKAHELQEISRELRLKLKTKAAGKLDCDPSATELDELSALSVEPEKPVLRRYMTNDSTVEMLGQLLSTNPRGLLVMRDELMGLLEGFERSGHEGERQFYLEGWNGTSPYQVDRVGRGHVSIPRLALSLFGGIQPDKLESYIYEMQTKGNDGFIQRFQLLVYPDDMPNFTIVDQEPDEAAKDEVMKIADVLANWDFTTLGATSDGPDSIPYFRFEVKKAQPLFYNWLKALDQRIRAEDAPLMQEHLGKYRKLVPALALTFHLVDMLSGAAKRGSPVNLKSLERAVGWAAYLETHARRIYALGTDYRVQAALALSKKIAKGQLLDGFSARDIARNDWSLLKDLDEVKAACDELEAAGWIRRLPKVSHDRAGGRPPLPKYEINPAINSSAGGAPPKPTKPPRKKRL